MIKRSHDKPIARQAEMLGISRGGVYYLPRPTPATDLAQMRRIDELHVAYPFAGSRMLQALLKRDGDEVGRWHVATQGAARHTIETTAARLEIRSSPSRRRDPLRQGILPPTKCAAAKATSSPPRKRSQARKAIAQCSPPNLLGSTPASKNFPKTQRQRVRSSRAGPRSWRRRGRKWRGAKVTNSGRRPRAA